MKEKDKKDIFIFLVLILIAFFVSFIGSLLISFLMIFHISYNILRVERWERKHNEKMQKISLL